MSMPSLQVPHPERRDAAKWRRQMELSVQLYNKLQYVGGVPGCSSVAVSVRLEGTSDLAVNVVCLLLGEGGEVRAQGREVQAGHLLIKLLRKQVHIVLVALLFGLQDVELSKNLVGEGAGHDKRWVASGAAQIEQSACGQPH